MGLLAAACCCFVFLAPPKGAIGKQTEPDGGRLLVQSPVAVERLRTLRIASAGAVLSADLYIPSGALHPLPAVVFVHGSERVERNRYRPFAERLGSKGLAVLIYDKRGVGESTGRFEGLNASNSNRLLRELAADARNAAVALSRQPEIDATRIGLFGGSQAGWVMPLAALDGPPIAFVAAMSAPAVSVGLEIFHGQVTNERRRGSAQPEVEELRQTLQTFRGLHGYDPAPTIAALKVPSLWLMGGRDRNLPVEQTVDVLRSIRAESNGRITIEVFPDADHQLARPDGSREDYAGRLSGWLATLGVLR